MIITHKMKMELTRKEYSKCIDVMQDDKYSRKLQIELLENRRKFVPPIGCSVRIHFKKQDGLGGVYDTMPDGTKAWSIEENTVTIHLAPQVCCAPGDVEMVITLSLGATELHCFAIYLSVKPAMDRDIKSGNYNCIRGLLPQPDKAKSGDFLRVKSVDEYGRILTMEAVEMQEDDSADREVYILADGEAMDNVPESAEIIIDLSEEAPVYIKTVNGNKPDENGNVKIEVGGGSGGGVSSWNDLTDKPFDSETVTVDPNFDNDLAGRVVVPMANTVNLVKITDYVLTEEECVGASVSVVMGGQSSTLPITTTGVIDLTAQFGIPCFMATPDMFLEYGLPFVAVIKESGTVQGLEVSAGTYYVSESSMALYVSHFSALDGIEYEIVQKLPAKYLPDSVANWNAADGEAGYVQNRTHWIEFIPEVVLPEKEYYNTAFEEYGWIFSGNVDGDEALDEMQLVEGETYVVTYKGTAYECVCKLYDLDGEQRPYLGNKYLLNGGEDTREPFAVETGCITIAETVSEYVSIGIEHMKESVRKLPEKFLPETVVLKKDIAQLSKVEWLPVREERTEPEVLFDIAFSITSANTNYNMNTQHGIASLPIEAGMSVKVLFNGVEYVCTVVPSNNTPFSWWLGDGSKNSAVTGVTESTGEPFLLMARKSDGLPMLKTVVGDHTMSMIAETTQIVPVPMPEEFLPASVDGVVIRSSTEGSTKKFKLTVDDSGNITATELT